MRYEQKLSEIADIVDSLHKTPTYSSTGKAMVRVTDIKYGLLNLENTLKVNDETYKEFTRRYKPSKGDIVVSRVGSYGNFAKVNDTDFCLGQNTAAISPKKIDLDYLYFALTSKTVKDQIEANVVGSTQKTLSLRSVSNINIPRFSSEVEKIIGLYGSTINNKIDLLKDTNQTLESIAQAIFKSWFVDFDPVHARQQGIKCAGIDDATAELFPDSFVESELGLIPKGWEVKTIGECFQVVDYVANGSFATLKENVTLYSEPNYALYVRTTDFNSNFNGDYRYVDEKAFCFLSKSRLMGDETIISNVGDVGTVFRPPKWLGYPMTLGSNAVAIKNKQMPTYAHYFFKSNKGQHLIQSIITGSAQLKFNKTSLRSQSVLIPSTPVIDCFESITGVITIKIDENQKSIKLMQDIRDTLLPRLISGKLDLSEIEEQLEGVV